MKTKKRRHIGAVFNRVVSELLVQCSSKNEWRGRLHLEWPRE